MDKESRYEQIGSRIRRLRRERGWTQDKLGELTNLSLTTISRLELGKQMVSVNRLIVIAEVLGVGIEEILADFVMKMPDSNEDAELFYILERMTPGGKEYMKKNMHLFYEYMIRTNDLQEKYSDEEEQEESEEE